MDGADIDHHSGIRRGASLDNELLGGIFAAEVRSFQIGADDRVEIPLVGVEDVFAGHNPRIVDHHIDPAESTDGSGDQFFHFRRPQDIGFHRNGVAARLPDLFPHLVRGGVIAHVVVNSIGPGAPGRRTDGGADSGVAAGHVQGAGCADD